MAKESKFFDSYKIAGNYAEIPEGRMNVKD